METSKFPPIEPLKFDLPTELSLLETISHDLMMEWSKTSWREKEEKDINFLVECILCHMRKTHRIFDEILIKLDDGK